MMAMHDDLQRPMQKLLAYCQAHDWAGHDPYDALDSRAADVLPFMRARLPRLLLTQAVKRSPIDFRGLLGVRTAQSSKAIALFLSALVKLSQMGRLDREELIEEMVERLVALRSPGTPYWCWGYSFPWQGRSSALPAGAPNLVCTAFVANALLDAYEHRSEPRCLDMAVNAADYMLSALYWTDEAESGFSYPAPSLRNHVHNANFLAAALLCRVHRHTGQSRFLDPAIRAARYAASQQQHNGAWAYGDATSQHWIDNFHTGYNLCALRSISRDARTPEFDGCMLRGLQFYRTHFVRDDGSVRYFHDRTYPIDTHCVAQSIITLLTFRDVDPANAQRAQSVFRWAMNHLWDERGYFYYRKLRFHTIRTSYMRWSQAWMLLALATLLQESQTGAEPRVDVTASVEV